MGTRGIWGFRKDGYDKVSYCHWDSYPEGLGHQFAKLLMKPVADKLDSWFDKIVEIDTNELPTEEQKQHCIDMGWFNGNVSNRNADDWYCLLRELQDPEAWAELIENDKVVYIDNYINFIKDSLFCEYAYIYDIDKKELEIYVGFQHEPQPGNRYGTQAREGNIRNYYPCRLVGTITMDELRNFAEEYTVTAVDHAVERMKEIIKEGE